MRYVLFLLFSFSLFAQSITVNRAWYFAQGASPPAGGWTYDSKDYAGSTVPVSSNSGTITLGANADIIFCGVALNSGDGGDSVLTFVVGSDTAIKIRHDWQASFVAYGWLGYILNPSATGAQTWTATYSASQTDAVAGVVAYSGASSTNVVNDDTLFNAKTSNPRAYLSPTVTNALFVAMVASARNDTSYTSLFSGTTSRWAYDMGADIGMMLTKEVSATGLDSIGVNFDASDWAVVPAAAFKPQ